MAYTKTEFDFKEQYRLLEQADAQLVAGESEAFIATVKSTYSATQYNPATQKMNTVEVPYFDSDAKRMFLKSAYYRQNFKVLEFLYEEGERLTDSQFKHIYNQYGDQPEVQRMLSMHLESVLAKNAVQKIRAFGQSNPQFQEKLKAMEPLLKIVNDIDFLASKEVDFFGKPNSTSKVLNAFTTTIRQEMNDLITGKSTPEQFSKNLVQSAQSSTEQVGKDSKAGKELKNVTDRLAIEVSKMQLMEQMKLSLAFDDVSSFESLMGQQYTVTVEKVETYEEPCGSYEYGNTGYETKTRLVPEDEERFYFTANDERMFCIDAVQNNHLAILEWLVARKPDNVSVKAINLFCAKNQDKLNEPSVKNIYNMLLDNALKQNSLPKVQALLKLTPKLQPRLDAIKPLFDELKSIDAVAAKEKGSWPGAETVTSRTLNNFTSQVRQQMNAFLKGTSNPDAFLTNIEQGANQTMAQLEQSSEAGKVMKNFLLCLTVVGPFIKKWATGDFFFNNSTTDEVNKVKDSFQSMKESLGKIKAEGQEVGTVYEESPSSQSCSM